MTDGPIEPDEVIGAGRPVCETCGTLRHTTDACPYTRAPSAGLEPLHDGVFLRAPGGTPVRAALREVFGAMFGPEVALSPPAPDWETDHERRQAYGDLQVYGHMFVVRTPEGKAIRVDPASFQLRMIDGGAQSSARVEGELDEPEGET